jgi:hypothetical protein
MERIGYRQCRKFNGGGRDEKGEGVHDMYVRKAVSEGI